MLLALLSSTLVSACEGDCIDGLTKALIGNYSHPVQAVFSALAIDLAEQALPSHSRTRAASILQPVLSLYNRQAYESMRAAEFPGFFHGKCQVNGVDPKGCPKPDCSVVCGTPGSIYHFYSTFVHIAYNTTLYGIVDSTSPNNSTSQYHAIKKSVLNDYPRYKHSRSFGRYSSRSQASQAPKILDGILSEIFSLANINNALEKTCGGASLPLCNWVSNGMKDYVLSWP